ncbi:MAG: hypothetical protein JO246_18005 [Frankiaceae bacterium]|nr:hypothetical protein [Frankiaceae bacterium]MBV9872821.1 hypothetical protein [Frankiaceae bacterium]
MTAATVERGRLSPGTRVMLNKVPEVTIYFWIIKILCTTVGESFADYINETLGVGLTNTTLIFSAALIVVGVAQFWVRRYIPSIYWTVVVLISVVGTLLTDNLTDGHNVPLRTSTILFSVLLAVVFAIWYARERTLSIHTIVTTPRESFYWLTVLVTFALGTAAGDWTLELTGWGPGKSVLLPAGLIAAIFVAWRLGAGPVLCFWLAFILTRPLGANIGDFLGAPADEGGQGLGTLWTSIIFLAAILATVVYLSITKKDQTERVYVGADGVAADHPGGRCLIAITDHPVVTPALVDALNARANDRATHVHLVVTNPASHEITEHHKLAHQAEAEVRDAVARLRRETSAEITDWAVSIRHDPMDAVEETIQRTRVDEVIVAVDHHRVAHALHQDLEDRLAHQHVAVTSVGATPPATKA